jgi:hypothetical protein
MGEKLRFAKFRINKSAHISTTIMTIDPLCPIYLILDFPKSRIKKARDMKLEPMSDLEI